MKNQEKTFRITKQKHFWYSFYKQKTNVRFGDLVSGSMKYKNKRLITKTELQKQNSLYCK